MLTRSKLRIVLRCSLTAIAMFFVSPSAQAQNLETATIYIKMDYWMPVGSQTAQAWHFDPNNGNAWTQLTNSPYHALPRAQFRVEELFQSGQLDPWVCFRGVPDVAVVRGTPGAFQDVSNQPAYSEMVNRLVIGIDNIGSGLTPHDPCGNRIWPIGVGSSLTEYDLSDQGSRPRAIRVVRDERFSCVAWRWDNPTGLPQDDVYLRIGLEFDKEDTPLLYDYVSVTWISAGGGCTYDSCLNSDQHVSQVGAPVIVYDAAIKIVTVVPFTQDHTTSLSLWKHYDGTDTLLLTSLPVNSNNMHSAHKCQPDGAPVAWHVHTVGVAGHLVVGGLSPWYGMKDVEAGTYGGSVFATAEFDIPPHETNDPFHTITTPIDCRAVFMVFWYSNSQPGG